MLELLDTKAEEENVGEMDARTVVLDLRKRYGVDLAISNLIYEHSDFHTLKRIKTYNTVKTVIWNCVTGDDGLVNLNLLRGLMLELKTKAAF